MQLILPIALLLAASDAIVRPGPGEPAPAFTAVSTSGRDVSLADYAGKSTLVLAFFPKAFTGGCTRELSTFRDRIAEFGGAGAQVLGISTDDLDTQKKFAESLTLPFPLLADPGGKVAAAYGVANAAGHANRVTFVISRDGKVVQVFEGRDALDPAGALSACGGKPSP